MIFCIDRELMTIPIDDKLIIRSYAVKEEVVLDIKTFDLIVYFVY